MKKGKITFAELLKYYVVTAQDKYNGKLDIYTEDGYWGELTKKYVQKICRETGHKFKNIYKR